MTLLRKYAQGYGVQVALVAVAFVWGGTFVVVRDAIALYPMYGFLAWRFAVAALAFVAFYPTVLKRLSAANVRRGLLAGVFLAGGYIFQTWGLDGATRTTPARAAFITGLYVVITPLLQAVVLRHAPRKSTVVGAAIAMAGLWVLSGVSGSHGTWVFGDTLVAMCAVAYSVHMIVLGSLGEQHDVGALTFVQLTTVAIACIIISAIKERPGVPTNVSVIVAIVLTGVVASALAFVIQTWAQSKLPPSRVALILVMEPAFGGVIGWTVAGLWPLREVLGAAMMLGGMIVSEALAAFSDGRHAVVLEPAVEGMPLLLDEGNEAFAGADSEAG